MPYCQLIKISVWNDQPAAFEDCDSERESESIVRNAIYILDKCPPVRESLREN